MYNCSYWGCITFTHLLRGPSWSWSYGSWINNYLYNQCLSPLKLWVWIPLRLGALDTTLCDKVCQWLATGQWFSLGTLISSTNKTDCHDITEILLKVALNTIALEILKKCFQFLWFSVKVLIYNGIDNNIDNFQCWLEFNLSTMT